MADVPAIGYVKFCALFIHTNYCFCFIFRTWIFFRVRFFIEGNRFFNFGQSNCGKPLCKCIKAFPGKNAGHKETSPCICIEALIAFTFLAISATVFVIKLNSEHASVIANDLVISSWVVVAYAVFGWQI